MLDKFARLKKNSNPILAMPGFYSCLCGSCCSGLFNFHQKLKRGKPESNFTTLGFLMATLFENEFDEFCLRSKNTGNV